MLDFYTIQDSATTPKTINQQKHAGGLTEEVFEQLMQLGVIDTRFDFYKDFRWNNDQVQKIKKVCDKIMPEANVEILIRILDLALMSNLGLIAISD